jgi:hypothetical protein
LRIGGDDRASSGSASSQNRATILVSDDEGTAGAEGSFSARDIVGHAWLIAKVVGSTLNGEIVHRVIQDDAMIGDDPRAERETDCCRYADNQAFRVGDRDV